MSAKPYRIPRCGTLKPLDPAECDNDPRGIVWIFEEPNPGASYYMGVDPTQGIINWDRRFRSEGDHNTDNGAIEVIRKSASGLDMQVAEYAAPVDPEDLADVANALGRLYGGNNEDGQALAIIEVWPGPGEPTQRRMITEYGYTNLYQPIRFANTIAPEHGRNQVGWVSNERSRRDLWRRGTKHIIQRKIRLRSPWLVEEMADYQADDWMYSETMRARHGKHDDRVVAMLLAIYCAHDWSWDFEVQKVDVSEGKGSGNWQASDISAEDMMDAWEERFSELQG